jgi:hypothetical protein
MENAAQLSPAQYSTGNDPDRFNTVDASFRHAARTQHNPAYGGDGYLNNNLGSWAYNGGANTVNGAMSESRLRPGARRAVIPAVRSFFLSFCTFSHIVTLLVFSHQKEDLFQLTRYSRNG